MRQFQRKTESYNLQFQTSLRYWGQEQQQQQLKEQVKKQAQILRSHFSAGPEHPLRVTKTNGITLTVKKSVHGFVQIPYSVCLLRKWQKLKEKEKKKKKRIQREVRVVRSRLLKSLGAMESERKCNQSLRSEDRGRQVEEQVQNNVEICRLQRETQGLVHVASVVENLCCYTNFNFSSQNVIG